MVEIDKDKNIYMVARRAAEDAVARVGEEGRFSVEVIDNASPEEGLRRVVGMLLLKRGDVEILKAMAWACNMMMQGLNTAMRNALPQAVKDLTIDEILAQKHLCKLRLIDGRTVRLACQGIERWEYVGDLVRGAVKELMR